MVFCSKCGKENSSQAKFCAFCGENSKQNSTHIPNNQNEAFEFTTVHYIIIGIITTIITILLLPTIFEVLFGMG